MNVLPVKIELERRLSTGFPTTPIAYPSVSFTAPAGLYLRCQIAPRGVEDPTRGDAYVRENYNFQVFVIGEINKGEAEVLTKAKQVADLYAKGMVIDVANLRIMTFKSPQIAGTTIVDSRLIAPVLIPVVVQVF